MLFGGPEEIFSQIRRDGKHGRSENAWGKGDRKGRGWVQLGWAHAGNGKVVWGDAEAKPEGRDAVAGEEHQGESEKQARDVPRHTAQECKDKPLPKTMQCVSNRVKTRKQETWDGIDVGG